MSDLTWALKLTDHLSIPAMTMSRVLKTVSGAIKDTSGALSAVDAPAASASKSIASIGASSAATAKSISAMSKEIEKVTDLAGKLSAIKLKDLSIESHAQSFRTSGALDSVDMAKQLRELRAKHAAEDYAASKAIQSKNLRNAAMGFARETGAESASIAGWREKFETGGIIKMRNEYNRLTEAAQKSARAMAVSKVESQLLSRSKPADASIVQRMIGGFGNLFGAKATGKLLGGMESLGKMDDELNKVGMSLGGVVAGGAAAASVAMLALAAAVTAVVVGLASLAVKAATAFTKFAVSTLSFRENTLIAFETILKSKEAASDLYKAATQFASATPFTTEQIMGAYQKLLVAGFKKDELATMMNAVGDVSAMKGFDPAVMNEMITGFAKLRGMGKLSMEVLQMSAFEGIQANVIAKLAEERGKTADEIREMISAGKIDAASAEKAILDVIKNTYSGGKLGGAMEKFSATWTGLWSTLASRGSDLFNAAANNVGGGLAKYFEAIKGFVKWLGEALNPESASGQRVVAIIDRVGGMLARLFGMDTKGDGMTKMFGGILTVIETLLPYFESFMKGFGDGFRESFGPLGNVLKQLTGKPDTVSALAKAFEALGRAFGTLGGVIAYGLEFIVLLSILSQVGSKLEVAFGAAWDAIWEKPKAALETLWTMISSFSLADAGASIGRSLIDGLIAGIAGGVSAAAGAASGAASAVIAAASGPKGFDAHSPSKKLEELGGFASEGLAKGITGKAPLATSAVSDMVSPPSPSSVASQWSSAAQPSRGGAGPLVSIQGLTINAESPDDYERKTMDLWERIAIQLNGAPA